MTIPDSAVRFTDNPFGNCPLLTDIVISPDHPALEIIGGAVFERQDHILLCCPCSLPGDTYEIPRGTKAIAHNAFQGCGFVRAAIPDSVTEISENPFGRCQNLTEWVVSPDHPTLTVIDGLLYGKADGTLIACPPGARAETWELPRETRAIGKGAFSRNSRLRRLTIPDGVTFIGENAFS